MMPGDPKLSNTNFKLPRKQNTLHIFICVIFKKSLLYFVMAASTLKQNALNRIHLVLKMGFTVAKILRLVI